MNEPCKTMACGRFGVCKDVVLLWLFGRSTGSDVEGSLKYEGSDIRQQPLPNRSRLAA